MARPEPRIAIRPRSLEEPAAQVRATPRGDALERGRHVERVVEGEHGLLRPLERRLRGRQVRVDQVAELRLHRLVEATGGAAPGDEERLPSARLCREGELLVDQGRERRDATGVEGVAEPGPDAVARQEPEHALVIRRAPAGPRGRRERVEQGPVRLARPLGALAEDAFELAQEVLGLAAGRVGARLAERALQELEGRVEPARRSRRVTAADGSWPLPREAGTPGGSDARRSAGASSPRPRTDRARPPGRRDRRCRRA